MTCIICSVQAEIHAFFNTFTVFVRLSGVTFTGINFHCSRLMLSNKYIHFPDIMDIYT